MNTLSVCAVKFSPGFGAEKVQVPSSMREKNSVVMQKAREELQRIENSKKTADAENAWWRAEYKSAIESLKKLANGEKTVSDMNYNPDSRVQMFHDFGEDGLI